MPCWNFDGVDDYIEIADNAAQKTLTSAGTWWGWIKNAGATSNYGPLLHKNNTTSAPWTSYAVGKFFDTNTLWNAQRGSGTNNTGTPTTTVTLNAWRFVAVTYNATNLVLRVWDDAGTLLDTQSVGATGDITYTAGQPLRLGRNESTGYFGGKMAYVGAHNTVLSDTDLATIRTTGVPPVTCSSFFCPLDTSTATDTAQSGTVTVYGATYDSADGPPVSVVPTGLTATAVDTDTITLAWDAYTGATGYDIERDGTIIVSDHATTSYTDEPLTSATEYDYRVRAVL